jgi:Leucine-rich repeat (LRR) protein
MNCSFWNEIPQQCTYDRTELFSCWNTTFIYPIPLLNNFNYTFQNHHVQIRDSYFAPNIDHLTLVNNTFSSITYNESKKTYFRLLQILEIYDKQSLQWLQLNSSYFPQLTKLDLSYNQFTNQKKLLFNQANFPILKSLNFSHNQLRTIDNITGNMLDQIEILILSFNPLETIVQKIPQFRSLIFLDLSSTLIKHLFRITLGVVRKSRDHFFWPFWTPSHPL